MVNVAYLTISNLCLEHGGALCSDLWKTCIIYQDLLSASTFLTESEMLIFSLDYILHVVQREEGVNIVVEAICSGIFNDLGSGSNVDVCVITKVGGSLESVFFSWENKSLI